MPGNLSMHLVWPSKYKGKWCFIPKCVFSEMDQHTALTLVAMQLACLRTSGCAEFGPLNTKENDVLFQNVFSQKQIIIQLWNLDHYNWHTWKPQGLLSLALQIHRKVMFYSKMCFLRNGSLYNFETFTIVIGMPGNLSMHLVWPSKYKEKWCFIPKCVFSEMDHHTTLKPVPLWSACLKTSGYTWVWPSKYKGKWCFIPKCVFSEMDQHTALKLVAMQLACLETSVYTYFGPPNTKESDVLFQNVFLQKQIIIRLWNLDHCNWHTWKPQGLLGLAL